MALSNDFNVAYDQFVSAWMNHERLRGGAGFDQRVESKQRLDDLRLRVRAFASHRSA